MKTLRVLHVLGEIRPSGAEMMLLTALPKFRSAGVEPALLSTGAVTGAFAERFGAAGCEVLHLPFRRAPGFFWHFYRLLRDPRWDVIHLHTERANFYFGLIALATGKTVLRTIHNVFGFEGGLRRRRALQRRILQALGLSHVAIGESVLNNERERFGLQTRLVTNWYDDRSFIPATLERKRDARLALNVDSDRPVIVTVGNCSDIKNHASLLRALALLPVDARPLLLHAGTEDSTASERLLCTELGLGLARDVRFLGPVAEVDRLLAACDIFVMPSLHEGMSIAAVEALGTGLPALLTNVPGLRDFARDFPSIAYCDPTPHALAQGLRSILSVAASPVAAREAMARSVVAKRLFGVERGVRAYIELYR